MISQSTDPFLPPGGQTFLEPPFPGDACPSFVTNTFSYFTIVDSFSSAFRRAKVFLACQPHLVPFFCATGHFFFFISGFFPYRSIPHELIFLPPHDRLCTFYSSIFFFWHAFSQMLTCSFSAYTLPPSPFYPLCISTLRLLMNYKLDLCTHAPMGSDPRGRPSLLLRPYLLSFEVLFLCPYSPQQKDRSVFSFPLEFCRR